MEPIKRINTFNIGVKTGLITFIGLIAYLLIMKAAGLDKITELRMLNFLILLGGVWLGIKQYYEKAGENMLYLKGLSLGFLVSLVAVIFFSIFIFFYTSWINPELMNYIQNNAPFGEFMNPWTAALIVFIEGLSSGGVISFVLMQYYKREHEVDMDIPDR